MVRMALLWAVISPSLVLAGADDQSVAGWLPFITKESPDFRANLAEKGVEFGLIYVMDNITNVTGGTRRGGIEFGRFDPYLDLDLAKLVGWTGATLHTNAYGLYGTGLTHIHILNLATVSEIEALPDLRLYELWIEQSLWGGAVAIKVGQQAADVEFFDSETDDLFINATFGWPAIFSQNLPAGGPSPPIAVPGARVKAQLSDQITAYGAIFNGNPAGPSCPNPPQLCDNHGLAFRLNDDPWLIGQARFDFNLHLGNSTLPGNVTPGAWYHSGAFDDKHVTTIGRSLADPAGSGVPNKLRGNYGVFAALEQTLYRAPGDNEKGVSATAKGITTFARVAFSPPDRNLIDFYADYGIGFSRLVPGRPDDRFGFATAYMHISNQVSLLDQDIEHFSGQPQPVRTFEMVVEAIYEAHVKPGWLLQPFFQYVFRPAGGIPNPYNPSGTTTRIGNAAIFGLTSTIRY
jgi:porin